MTEDPKAEGTAVPQPKIGPETTGVPMPPETVGTDEAATIAPPSHKPDATAPQDPSRARCRPTAKRSPLLLGQRFGMGASLTPEQRLLLLDTWLRSGLTADEFGQLVGICKSTLHSWKKKFDEEGPGGLVDHPRGARKGTRLSEVTKRAILMMRQANPNWGCQRISDLLVRGPGLAASPQTVARVLTEAGIDLEVPTHATHETPPRRFERAKPNQLWQTDLFTFTLKRQNRRVYMIGFLDDCSRFLVSYGVYGSSSTAMVIEVLNAGIINYGPPEEVLTDNGPQYVTWRGKSAFTKELEKRGIRQIVSKPKHPESLGKIERIWGSLWKECLESATFFDLDDARVRIGHYIDYYNFQRPHQGIDGLVPADRFFGAAEEVKKTLAARVADNALALARYGTPKEPFYVTGQVGGQSFSVHAEGERVILTQKDGERREIEIGAPSEEKPPQLPPPVCPQGGLPAEATPEEKGGEA